MNILGLISQLIGIKTLRLTDTTLDFHENNLVDTPALANVKS